VAVQQLEQKAYEMRNTNNKVRSSAAATNRIAGGITKAQHSKQRHCNWSYNTKGTYNKRKYMKGSKVNNLNWKPAERTKEAITNEWHDSREDESSVVPQSMQKEYVECLSS
jgi:hypothetical protein